MSDKRKKVRPKKPKSEPAREPRPAVPSTGAEERAVALAQRLERSLPDAWRLPLHERGVFEADAWKQTCLKLQLEYDSGFRVFPDVDDILAAFRHTRPDEIDLIVVGQDPYHEEGQADGHCFSVKDATLPSSVRNILKEMESDLRMWCRAHRIQWKLPEEFWKPRKGRHAVLKHWARKRVLMINGYSLTVRQGKAESHGSKEGWSWREAIIDPALKLVRDMAKHSRQDPTFPDGLFKSRKTDPPDGSAMDTQEAKEPRAPRSHGVVFAWGQKAIKILDDLNFFADDLFLCLVSSHPSGLSANKTNMMVLIRNLPTGRCKTKQVLPSFMGSRPFSRANEWLMQHGRPPIQFLRGYAIPFQQAFEHSRRRPLPKPVANAHDATKPE
jgi:uracil DNA glycosylase